VEPGQDYCACGVSRRYKTPESGLGRIRQRRSAISLSKSRPSDHRDKDASKCPILGCQEIPGKGTDRLVHSIGALSSRRLLSTTDILIMKKGEPSRQDWLGRSSPIWFATTERFKPR